MINRKELLTSFFNKKNLARTVDLFLPEEQPEAESFYDIPELTGEMLTYEAMRLGIDPATVHPDRLREVVMTGIIKEQKKQAPSGSSGDDSFTDDPVNG